MRNDQNAATAASERLGDAADKGEARAYRLDRTVIANCLRPRNMLLRGTGIGPTRSLYSTLFQSDEDMLRTVLVTEPLVWLMLIVKGVLIDFDVKRPHGAGLIRELSVLQERAFHAELQRNQAPQVDRLARLEYTERSDSAFRRDPEYAFE